MENCQRLGITFVAGLDDFVITHNVLAETAHAAQKLVKQSGDHRVSVVTFGSRMAIHTGVSFQRLEGVHFCPLVEPETNLERSESSQLGQVLLN